MNDLARQNQHLKALLAHSLDKNVGSEKLGRVFHDFNNILSSSMGYSNLAGERAKATGDEKLIRYLDNIEKAGIRARDLVKECLQSRNNERNAYTAEVNGVVSTYLSYADAEAVPDQNIFMSAELLGAAISMVVACYGVNDCEPKVKISGEVIDEPHCSACNSEVRGRQLRLLMKVDNGGFGCQIDDGNAYLNDLFTSFGGHMCKSLMQENQFVVYLRSADQ